MDIKSRLADQIKDRVQSFGWKQFGFTQLARPISMDIYKSWLEQEMHGEMHYLHKHQSLKEQPNRLLASARSAIVIAQDYFPHPKPVDGPLKHTQVALYARGEDYHHWFKAQLEELITQLKKDFPGEEFLAFTDSGPVLERDLAYKAGLGWVGKNTCLIHKDHGSLFFIGEILTSLELSAPEILHPDRCGNCRRCIDICPTKALSENKQLDARLCISYLNIEAKSTPKKELRSKMGEWLFGCDLCQSICPWNEKAFGLPIKEAHTYQAEREDLLKELSWLLNSSNKKIQKTLAGTALMRAGGKSLKRNAMIVAANRGLTELTPDISRYLDHKSLAEVANWSLNVLNS